MSPNPSTGQLASKRMRGTAVIVAEVGVSDVLPISPELFVEVGGEKQWEKRALCEHSDVKIFFGACPHDTT